MAKDYDSSNYNDVKSAALDLSDASLKKLLTELSVEVRLKEFIAFGLNGVEKDALSTLIKNINSRINFYDAALDTDDLTQMLRAAIKQIRDEK